MISAVSIQDKAWLLRDKYQLTDESLATAAQRAEIEKDLSRLAAGEPLAYVVGWVNFLGCQIDLRYKPLIPRPETEYWVENLLKNHTISEQFAIAQKERRELKILDLCCGSGCIGTAVLKKWPAAQVDFVDVAERALQQTQLNLEVNHISIGRFQIIHSNLFTELNNNRYDFILTNPPYVDPEGEFSGDLEWEPSEALFAQKHGLGLIREIIFNSKNHLLPKGRGVMEFGKGQEAQISEWLREAGATQVEFTKDQFGIVRTVTWLFD